MTPFFDHPTMEGILHEHWTRSPFVIAMEPPKAPVRVDGISMVDAPAIGLHVGITHFIDVTHIPTGKRIGGFHTLGAAMEFVHRIAHLVDWNQQELTLEPEVLGAVQDVYAKLLASELRPHSVT